MELPTKRVLAAGPLAFKVTLIEAVAFQFRPSAPKHRSSSRIKEHLPIGGGRLSTTNQMMPGSAQFRHRPEIDRRKRLTEIGDRWFAAYTGRYQQGYRYHLRQHLKLTHL